MTITDILANTPHDNASVKCPRCGYKWEAVYPSEGTVSLDCPECHHNEPLLALFVRGQLGFDMRTRCLIAAYKMAVWGKC
uniref:Uncharacterized protein n=1 Tax=viral metagenome TaxID=1070528 RepID=A0A6M3M877_9ZZZZ